MWMAFPNEPPIKRFVRGHIYHIMHGEEYQRVLEFKRVKGGKSFCFMKVADKRSTPDYYPNERRVPGFQIDRRLKRHMIKELKVEDLPLYISWNTYPRFVELLKGGPHKTRALSKSSIVISRRQEYDAKRIARELKSVK